MTRRRLGQSSLEITPIGLGTWAIGGGDWILGWGPQSDSESLATIRRALSHEINWIDTAAAYGLGHAETIVGRALRYVSVRERPYIFTKGGFAWDDLGNIASDLDPRTIRRQAEGSLRRLAVDAIDVYHLELPVPGCPVLRRAGSAESAWEAIAALQQAGHVRFIGITNPDPLQLPTLHRIAPVTSVQVRYSLVRRDLEREILPLCQKLGIAVIAASPMESGCLAGSLTPERLRTLPHNDWRRWCPPFQPDGGSRATRVVGALTAAGARRGVSPGAIALAWVLRLAGVTALCAGARRPAQIESLAMAMRVRLTAREAADLDSAASGTVEESEQPALTSDAVRR